SRDREERFSCPRTSGCFARTLGSWPVVSILARGSLLKLDGRFHYLVVRHRLHRVVYVVQAIARADHFLEWKGFFARRQKVDGLEPVARLRRSNRVKNHLLRQAFD